MDVLESKAFRTILAIVTVIVLYLALRQCATEDATGGETRTDATEETIDVAELPSPAAADETAVIIETTPVPAQELNELLVPITSGDTLNEIAIRYNVSVDVIMRANPGLDPSSLQIGQKIRVPGAQLDPSALENPSTEREEGVTVDYFVEEGDTLGGIAESYTVSLEALMGANPSLDPSSLGLGSRVIIPPFGTGIDPSALTPVPTITPVPRAIGEPLTVIVQPGDTLATIASTYGVTLNSMMSVNAIDDANNIFVGQELLVPPPPP